MTAEFQEKLLKFLFQIKESKNYWKELDQNIFDDPFYKVVYSLWYDYVGKYQVIPSKANFLQYTEIYLTKQKAYATKEVYDAIRKVISIAYSATDDDIDFTRDQIIMYARKKGMRDLFTNKAGKIKDATFEELDGIYTEMRRIIGIGSNSADVDRNRGGFMFRDADTQLHDTMIIGHPTFLDSLNKMTAARGFYSPQLLLLLGGPKAFKTGVMLTLMIHYAKSGLNVFVADAENGAASIKTRIKQALLECERHELGKYKAELKYILNKLKLYGGDIVVHHFPGKISTLDDVDTELTRLREDEGWTPHVIMYDYLQLFASTNKRLNNKQDQLQDVYHHAKRINTKFNCFAWTAAKVRRDAVNKLVIKTDDFGEDFGQAYNCDATYALCRTETEQANGYGRLVPVLQREGTAYKFGASTTCALKINEATQSVTELDAEAYMATLEDEYKNNKARPGHQRKYIPPNKLKDE
jgi:hypothetical protein